MNENVKPVAILIAAMGGEGGGVLADWLIDAAKAQDFPVQSTSVPGVAQRTGATTYYVEIFPLARSALNGREPVLSLTPNPGDVDLVAASELVEAGRVLQGGFVHPQRTVLVSSTHREYAVSEKAAMGDGRYEGQRVLDAAERLAHRAILFDMRKLALRHGTVINTVIFGAMAGSGILPLSRQACEQAIRRSGKAVEASLRGFAAGFERAVSGAASAAVGVTQPARQNRREAKPSTRVMVLSEPVREIVAAGVRQTSDYQGQAYATLYLDRVEAIHAVESQGAVRHDVRREVTKEAARYLALWMSYEDVIRVADFKTRRERIDRVRREVGARDGEPLKLTEYLKPGLDEICSLLPVRLAQWIRRKLDHKAHRLNVGLHMRTDTILGFAMLCGLRSLRPLRPYTSRYAAEQTMIDRWLGAIRLALCRSAELAHELALCGNLVKGYGETSERGHRNLASILDDAENRMALDMVSLTRRVRSARMAALADPEGRELAGALGLPAPEPKAHPVRIVRRRPAN